MDRYVGDEPTLFAVEPPRGALGEAATIAAGPQADASPSALGETFGRYLIHGTLGAGGMGVVYSAFDPELDRLVALKLLRAAPGAASTDGRARLLREAQAMARISHPNVVAVHDVGEAAAGVFIAMEIVAGGTLRAWLSGRSHDPEDILERFLAAGRGLAAAHAAGVVHRDFKPDNVLLDAAGTPRVTDFGLARAERSTTADSGVAAVDGHLTLAGAIMGTPAYMAPEQHQSRPADARADIFAFSASLWEALYGELPFAGETYAELAREVVAGRLRRPRRPRGPASLRRALERGLRPDPDARWPTMDALLDALERVRGRRRRRRLALAGVVALVVGGGAAQSYEGFRERAACEASAAVIDELWGPAPRERARAAILATALPYAADAWSRIAGHIDAWAATWRARQIDACLAARTPDDLTPRRLECLRERVRHLGGLVDRLRAADREVLERAVQAAASLPTLADCDDSAWLTAAVKPPEDPALRAVVDAQREALALAEALERTGHYAEGLRVSEGVLAAAAAIAYPPLRLEASHRHGRLSALAGRYPDATAELAGVYFEAGALGHDDLQLQAALALVWVVGVAANDLDAGLEWARHADMLVRRLGREDALDQGVELIHLRGQIFHAKDDLESARALLGEALARREAAGPDRLDVADSRLLLGTLDLNRGALAEARAGFEAARAIYGEALGARHPAVARALNWLGNVAYVERRLDDALALHEEALAIRRAALGETHPDVGASLNNIGLVLSARGDHDGAIAAYRASLTIKEAHLSHDHPAVAASYSNLGEIFLVRGEHAEALAHFEEALRRWEASLGREHSSLTFALHGIGRVHLARGELAAARAAYERGLALRDDGSRDRRYLADLRFGHAQVLWETGPATRAAALEAAEAARDDYDAVGLVDERAQVDAWLAERALPAPEARSGAGAPASGAARGRR